MNVLKNTKLLAGIVIVVVLALIYMSYSSLSSSSAVAPGTVSPVSQNLLVALSSLHTIHLDGEIFSDPVFESLSDFGVTIPTQAIGRRNPFQATFSAPAQTADTIKPAPGTR